MLDWSYELALRKQARVHQEMKVKMGNKAKARYKELAKELDFPYEFGAPPKVEGRTSTLAAASELTRRAVQRGGDAVKAISQAAVPVASVQADLEAVPADSSAPAASPAGVRVEVDAATEKGPSQPRDTTKLLAEMIAIVPALIVGREYACKPLVSPVLTRLTAPVPLASAQPDGATYYLDTCKSTEPIVSFQNTDARLHTCACSLRPGADVRSAGELFEYNKLLIRREITEHHVVWIIPVCFMLAWTIDLLVYFASPDPVDA